MDQLVTQMLHCSIHQDLTEISHLFSTIDLNQYPKLYNYLADDFKLLAKEYDIIIRSLEQSKFHMVFDPKPDIDIFSDQETNEELVNYLNKNRKGYTMLSELIQENFQQYQNLESNIVESLVDYYIECIQM